jgi:hypothetical protein
MRVVLQKVISVVKLQKYVKLPLGIYVKVFLSIRTYIKCEKFTKSMVSSKLLLNCR